MLLSLMALGAKSASSLDKPRIPIIMTLLFKFLEADVFNTMFWVHKTLQNEHLSKPKHSYSAIICIHTRDVLNQYLLRETSK